MFAFEGLVLFFDVLKDRVFVYYFADFIYMTFGIYMVKIDN